MLKSLAALLLGAGLATGAHAQGASPWQIGKHYFPIEPPQATTTGDKVEVVEVLSYACPACNSIVGVVDGIKKSLPANAEFVLVPAQFGNEAWRVYARALYTAQALGIAEKAHADVFRAIYVDNKLGQNKVTIEEVADFYSRYGVSAADFLATSTSFAVQARLKRNEALIRAYGVDGTPSFVVNGKYRLSGSSAGGYQQLGELILYLVAKESASN